MGTRTCAGAWSIDLPGVSGKTPAGDFSRRLVTSTPTTTISTPAGRAFPLPSKSSVQSPLHATIFPDSETVHHRSVRMRFMRTPNAQPLHRSTTAEPSCARCRQRARPATRMTIGLHCMRRPPHDLLSWACRFHFRSSFNCGRITDVAEFLICANKRRVR
jgi:hypothetical protein